VVRLRVPWWSPSMSVQISQVPGPPSVNSW